ncbi:MAG: SH3 domain-containing protein [Chloroflexota bacterium]
MTTSRQFWLWRFFLGIVLLFSAWVVVRGQDSILTDGGFVTGDLPVGTPLVYSFSGTGATIVTAQVRGNAGFSASMTLTDSGNQELATSDADGVTASDNDVRLTTLLSTSGIYLITLTNLTDVPQPFVLTFDVLPVTAVTDLSGRQSVEIVPDDVPVFLRVQANPVIPQVISIQSLTLTTEFSAQIFDTSGDIRAVISENLEGSTVVVPASDGEYLIRIVNIGDASAELEVAILAGEYNPDETGDTSPDTTVTQPATDSDACAIVIDDTPVNVRSGPGTIYEVVNGLGDGDEFIATGQNGAWYNGTVNGLNGWVATSVTVQVNPSNCTDLVFVPAPPPPTPTSTPTPTFTPIPPTSTPTSMGTGTPMATTMPTSTSSP